MIEGNRRLVIAAQGRRRSFPRVYPAVLRPAHPHTYAPRPSGSAYTLRSIVQSCRRAAFAQSVPKFTLGAHDSPSGRSVFDRSLRPKSSTSHSILQALHSVYTHSGTLSHDIGHELIDITAWAHHERASPGEEHITDSCRRSQRR